MHVYLASLCVLISLQIVYIYQQLFLLYITGIAHGIQAGADARARKKGGVHREARDCKAMTEEASALPGLREVPLFDAPLAASVLSSGDPKAVLTGNVVVSRIVSSSHVCKENADGDEEGEKLEEEGATPTKVNEYHGHRHRYTVQAAQANESNTG